MKGVLLVDKPTGMTSHDVVDRVRKASGFRKIGHTGTLDPGATGLLVLCLGAATRLSEFLTGLDKVYEGTMTFGIVTDSYDMDGTVQQERPVPPITADGLQTIFDSFTGDIMQVPPMVSAVKVGGKRLYQLARKGQIVEREPRKVTVREFSLLDLDPPHARFRVRCTRGTYARVLAFDTGEILGCGATLSSLRRTEVGAFKLEDACTLDSLTCREDVQKRLLSVDNALDLPQVVVKPGGKRTVESGGTLGLLDIHGECPVDSGWVQVKAENGELLALAEVEAIPFGVRIQPKRVLCGQS